jgi:hypothetical protein
MVAVSYCPQGTTLGSFRLILRQFVQATDSVRWNLLFNMGFYIVLPFVKLGSLVRKVKFHPGF